MTLKEEEDEVPDGVWKALWCPRCGSQKFGQHRFEGTYCDGCGTELRLQSKSAATVRMMFRRVPAWGLQETEAEEIDGVLVALLVRKSDGWHVHEWLDAGDNTIHPPDTTDVDKVKGTELTETDRMEMWN
jgi:hypothetical protein